MGSVTLQEKSIVRIKEEMEKAGLTVSKLAKDIWFVNRVTASNFVNGNRPVSFEYIDLLAERLDVRAEWLLGEDDYRTDEEFEKATSGFYLQELKEGLKKRAESYNSAIRFLKCIGIKSGYILTVWFNMKEMDFNIKSLCDFYSEYISESNREKWDKYKQAVSKYYQLNPVDRRRSEIIDGFMTEKDYYFRITKIPQALLDNEEPGHSQWWGGFVSNKEEPDENNKRRFPVLEDWFFPYNVRRIYRVETANSVRYMSSDSFIDMLEMISGNVVGTAEAFMDLRPIRNENMSLCPQHSNR